MAAEVTDIDKVKPAFDKATTEAEFLRVLKAVLQHPKAPDFLLSAFHDFYNNYKSMIITAAVQSIPPGGSSVLLRL